MPSIDTLPECPRDNYDWDIFFGDQAERPLIFHGTSAAFAESIKDHGLAFQRRPWRELDLRRLVDIFGRHKLYGPKDWNIAVLSVYTQNTARLGCVSLCFDWIRVCGYYAIRSPGGETLSTALVLAQWMLQHHRDRLARDDLEFLSDLEQRGTAMIRGHKPLVVAFEFDPSWCDTEGVKFFVSRDTFAERREMWRRLRGSASYEFTGLHQDGGTTYNGKELLVRGGVPASAIRAMYVLETDHQGRHTVTSL